MYSKIRTRKSIENYSDSIKKLQIALAQAEAVVVGAGAGFSTSAGFVYSGERFQNNFHDFIERYGFHDMYSGGFYPFDSLEEHWAYWSRYIQINRYQDAPNPVYTDLFALLKDKDYFVLTTNVDHQFQKAGFDKERLFYTQGDYGLFQCSIPCHLKTYDNEESIGKMVEQQKNMKIPSELIPYCPKCGKPMSMNLRADTTFVQDGGWYLASERYAEFISRHKGRKLLYLELGVGANTPGIIKYPFWQMTAQNENAIYACINYGEAVAPKEIERKSICINQDIGEVLNAMI